MAIVDQLISMDKFKIFYSKVLDRDAPGYSDLIMCPIDFTVMRNKAKRNEYGCADEFLKDMSLLH